MAFEIKQSFKKNLNIARSLNDLQIKMHQDGFKMRFQYKGEYKTNQSNEVQDVWINKIYHNIQNQPKDGFFYKKFDGFSLSAIDGSFADIGDVNSRNQAITSASKKSEDSILEIAEDLVENVLKPTYVAQQEDDWWKKKRKGRR